MHTSHHRLLRATLGACTLLTALSGQAQTSSDLNVPPATARQQQAEIARGDPARWFQEDATTEARMRTLRKEIAAGLQENLGNCKSLAQAERRACMQEARAIYSQEMAGVRERAVAGR
jgi:hypothetical protein